MKKLKVTEYTIHPASKNNRPQRAFTAVFLSDLHDCRDRALLRALAKEIRKAAPSMVLCGGDQVTAADGNCRMRSAGRFSSA